jgi:predicted lipid-binding transport protein (Tim44 family)
VTVQLNQFRRSLEDSVESEISDHADQLSRDVVAAVWNAVDDQIGAHRQYAEDAGKARDFAQKQAEHIAAKRDLAEQVLGLWEKDFLAADEALRMVRSALATGDVKTLDQLRTPAP